MNYGEIIKRAWHITWRYKALWVLGIFAGVSGCQGGGGGNGGSFDPNQWRSGSSEFGTPSPPDFGGLERALPEILPMLIALAFVMLLLVIVLGVIGIAARGGLVTGASAYEEGRRPALGELWGAGFGRFWTLVGLDILLRLPVLAVALLLVVLVFAPLVGTRFGGGDPGVEVVAPICGSLAIGVPILLLMSLVLGVMYLIALRYVMLGGQGAFQAAKNSWSFLRARLKDTVLLWLINAGLNIVGSFALAIPFIVIGIAVAIPLAATLATQAWGAFAGLIALLLAAVMLVAFAYNAVWGTFTSALWTCFFRDAAGMPGIGLEPPVAPSPSQAAAGFPAEPPAPPAPPAQDGGWVPAPPAAPAPEDTAPPVAPWPPSDE